MVITLAAVESCGDANAICTRDGGRLVAAVTVTVAGPDSPPSAKTAKAPEALTDDDHATDDEADDDEATADDDQAQSCPDVSPTGVAVAEVPVVVESTEADYFVLYASFGSDEEAVEYPVRVVLGQDGTTTLEENVGALAADRYRVEKYLVAEPGDVDGDCIDDITELNNPATMNPVNRAAELDLADGAVIVPDAAAFEALALSESYSEWLTVKFTILNKNHARPKVYFINTEQHPHHDFFIEETGVNPSNSPVIEGSIIFAPDLTASDGTAGLYFVDVRESVQEGLPPFAVSERVFTLLAASMPVVDNDLSLAVLGDDLHDIQDELPLFWGSRGEFGVRSGDLRAQRLCGVESWRGVRAAAPVGC